MKHYKTLWLLLMMMVGGLACILLWTRRKIHKAR